MMQDVRDHGNAMGLVERAPTGFGDRAAAIADNGDIFHPITLVPFAYASPRTPLSWIGPNIH
jgi:hypothetical protein